MNDITQLSACALIKMMREKAVSAVEVSKTFIDRIEFVNPLEFTYSSLFNLMGWPSTVVRCGTSNEGLPIGLQILAKPWHDHVSLAVAYNLQKILNFERKTYVYS